MFYFLQLQNYDLFWKFLVLIFSDFTKLVSSVLGIEQRLYSKIIQRNQILNNRIYRQSRNRFYAGFLRDIFSMSDDGIDADI